MKGVVIERATAGNILDVYALFKEMVREGEVLDPKTTPEQVRAYYWQLLNELANPHELILLARRGRTYWGYFHGSLAFRPFGTARVIFIRSVFVSKKKRKMGIAKQLYESARGLCQKMGINTGEFMCDDKILEHWVKKVGAKKKFNFMVVE
jgi:L-amino acid N-acyltransferase YncA